MKKKRNIVFGLALLAVVLLLVFGLNGCTKADRVNWNTRQQADNFDIRRRVVALNTRTDKILFEVEGLISLTDDDDGDLNVMIKTNDGYKLFYAHLSKDVTYTCIQLEPNEADPYAYDIRFFPAKEVIEHGLINIESSDETTEAAG